LASSREKFLRALDAGQFGNAAGFLPISAHRSAKGRPHDFRGRGSNWLVNKAKENPKTVQGILGHSRIQTTLDLYTDEDLDEMIAAQDKFIDAVGFERETVQ
jgi:integrase